ncbi:hypothetical protein CPB83DRAFT_897992 [Crepidotus variabilis]|uniref:FAD-binding PCMH-type domain-containing protein n=1 Tax=Crepidotus variabilis TaxID=179855 RepID=A0A9P6E8M8_9AGAR|nr:hypothetical protein CPB83DRAFT_897992 [Crepidotus variabilis]
MVWVHHMKNGTFSETFIPEGAPSNASFSTITIGGGAQWIDAYNLANQHGQLVVGGISEGGTVGAAGGWLAGGGHGVLSPRHGVDNVLEFKVVIADGSLVTANAHENSDLFWALRGGGGATYAIVISVTYKTYPSFGLGLAMFQANFTSPDVAQKLVAATVRSIRNFADAGWGGYLYILQSAVAGIWVAPNTSQSDTEAAFTPYASYLYNVTGGQGGALYNSTSSFYEWFYGSFILTSGQAGSSQVGGNVYIASRLLSREINPDDAAKAILSVPTTVGLNVVGGGAVNRIDPSSTGLNPSWRHALAEAYVTESWDDGSNVTVIQQAADNLKKSTDILEGVATDSGSYLNEGSLFERNFKNAFYGAHYSSLRAIKQKYDPNSLFVVPTGVASDEWDRDLTCRVG